LPALSYGRDGGEFLQKSGGENTGDAVTGAFGKLMAGSLRKKIWEHLMGGQERVACGETPKQWSKLELASE